MEMKMDNANVAGLQPFEMSSSPISQNTNTSKAPLNILPAKRSVLGTLAAPDTPSMGALWSHSDASIRDRLDGTCASNISVWDRTTEEQLAVENLGFYTLLNNGGFATYCLQAVAMIGTVVTYVAPPVVISWAKTVAYTSAGNPVKVDTFLPVSVVLVAKVVVVFISASFAMYWDCKERQGRRYQKWMFSCSGMKPLFTLGGIYALADIAEIQALGCIDPATYMVLSQLHLVGSALITLLSVGTMRSYFQWSILASLSLVIIRWLIAPDRFRENDATFGYIFCVAKMFLSLFCGAIMQRQVRDFGEVPLLVQSAHLSIAGLLYCVVFTPVLLFGVYPALRIPWVDYSGEPIGFFGGKLAPGIERGASGWLSGKTYAVLGIYIFREIFSAYGIKRFNSLAKNTCSAIALVVAYALAVWWLEELQFNQVKGILAIVISLGTLQYGLAESRETK